MTPKRIVFEMFESDLFSLDISSNHHEIDREVRLEFTDHQTIFVSWEIMEDGNEYKITYSDKRFFEGKADVIRDMSSLPIFRAMIGQHCSFGHIDPMQQILHLRSKHASIYFSSQENDDWGMDVVHISNEKPSFNS